MKQIARNKKMQRYMVKHLFVICEVDILLTSPSTSMKGHLYDPEICYTIKTVTCRENPDVLLMTLLEKLDRASVTPNAGWTLKRAQHQVKEGSEKKGKVGKLWGHYRSYFVP